VVWHETTDDDDWSVAQTSHFCLYHRTTQKGAEKLLRAAERARTAQLRKWFAAREAAWTSACRIYLYPSGREYALATGVPAEAPGHTDIQMDGQRVLWRRINLHGDTDELSEAVLPHEVTHAVLAGRFAVRQVPRWADEGMAVLAEPDDRVQCHREYLRRHQEDGLYDLGDVMRMSDYPAGADRGLFYAQSVSLVDFLVRRQGPQAFTRFVQRGLRDGYEAALQKEYGWTFAELERHWRREALTSAAP
jgi:hypothetical protein